MKSKKQLKITNQPAECQNMEICHILVSGRVQGVGFRQFVFGIATDLALQGFVRNLRDGRVEILTNAPEDKLNIFMNKIKLGTTRAVVETLVISKIESTREFQVFTILEDGEAPCKKILGNDHL